MHLYSPRLLRAGLRYLLRHPWQGLLALTGIALGVAVVLAVDLANQAARASFELSAQQLQGRATHRLVHPSSGVSEQVYADWFRQADAPPMAPVVEGWVRIAGHSGRYRLLGLDLFAEVPFRSHLDSISYADSGLRDWLSRTDALLLNQSAVDRLQLEPGQALQVVHQGDTHTLRLLAVDTRERAGLEDVLLVDIATAQAVLGMQGQLSHIDLVLGEAQRSWVEQRIPSGLRLLTVEEEAAGVTRLSAAFELNLTAMSLLALLVGMFLIFNAMSFSLVQRRNLLGRLRAVGITPAELLRLIMAEALVLAFIGTLIGLGLGTWLGQGLTRIVAGTVSELYYNVSNDALGLSLWSLLKAAVLGIGATLLATLYPALQAARTPALSTLSRASLETAVRGRVPYWAGAGSLLLIGGWLIAMQLPGGVVVGFAGLFLMVVGAAMLTPLMLRLLHRLLVRLRLTGVLRMGVRDLDRHLSRLGIAVAALMVALSASVGVGLMVDSMRGAVDQWLRDLLQADLYVAAEAFADGASLPSEVARTVPALKEVADFSHYRSRTLEGDHARVRLVAARLAPASRSGFDLLDTPPERAWRAFDSGGVLISEPLAYRLGLGEGDAIGLPTETGERRFPIAAVFRDYASEHGRVFMPDTAYRQHWRDLRIDTLALFAAHADAEALRAVISARFAEQHALVLTPASAILRESLAVFDRTFRITQVLRLLSLAVAFIGVLSALMALQLERSKEFAVLRALGLTRAQIAGLISAESLFMGLVAGLLSIPLGLLMAWILIASIQRRAFGWSMPFHVDVGLLAQTCLLALLAAALAAAYPAWHAARREPAPQLREE